MPSFSTWEADSPPEVPTDLLRSRAQVHAPAATFTSKPEFTNLFGQSVTVLVQNFAAREIYKDYQGKSKARDGAETPSSARVKQSSAGSNWAKLTFPKHVRHAVAGGRLAPPAEQYLQMVTVRAGAHPKSVVLKLDDFIAIYRPGQS
jgi:hypothetical protein